MILQEIEKRVQKWMESKSGELTRQQQALENEYRDKLLSLQKEYQQKLDYIQAEYRSQQEQLDRNNSQYVTEARSVQQQIQSSVKETQRIISQGREEIAGIARRQQGVQEACERSLQDQEQSALEKKISEAGQVAAKELEEACKKLALEKVRLDEKNQIDRELPELQTLLKEKTEELQKNNTELSARQARLEEKKNQAEALRKKLKFKDIDQAREAQAELENQIGQFKLAYESAQKNYEEKQSEFTSLKSQIEQLKNQLKDTKEINVDELREKLDGLDQERGGLLSQKSLVDSRLDANKKALDNIREQSQELAAVQEKYSYVSALSKTANGGLSGGKEKIKLETFIQMTYFDRIIAHANKRLMIMSDMQYELVRRKEASDLRSQTGLELDVIDHYNGGQRSVKSLSGGESFQASLALALGLSDEVRLSAGGIKIDTMFIDEGFGTLDSEALQKAFKALSAITEGNRLVGIISHVDLLKEKIERQIMVKKARTGGSSVTMIL